jgi:soluble lytic murein transglycosylase-like protein
MPPIGRRQQLHPLVKSVAVRFNVDPELVDALVIVESSYNPWALRYEEHFHWLTNAELYAINNRITTATETQCQKFSWGLCQIMGGTARSLGFGGPLTKLMDPELNTVYACKYLGKLASKYPALDDMIAAYNAGSPRKGDNGAYVNQGYVDKVKKAMAEA